MSEPWWRLAPPAPDQQAAGRACERQVNLTKPPGSLGQLETLAIQMAALQGTEHPRLGHIAIGIFAADHGVAAEGVSAFPQAVTAEMVRNFARGGAAISVLARQLDADFQVINVGTVTELEALPNVLDRRVRAGTANFVELPAMTDDECEAALAIGRDWVDSLQVDLVIGGEMGIANTTAASALAVALTGQSVTTLTGRGTGVDDAGLRLKQSVIERALQRHSAQSEPFALLAALGGLELAALAGAYIRAGQRGIPSLVDGFICTAAALAAVKLNPELRPWLLFSHCSAEQGHRALLQSLNAEPLLALNLRLGEASGAALAVPLIQAALQLHNQMATFAEAGISGGSA